MLNKSTRSFVIIALITLLGSPALVLASTETSTVRSQNGSLVYLGDSYANLMQKMQQAPVSQRSYEWEENRKKLTAVDYIYLIDNTYYTVTVVNNVVKKLFGIVKLITKFYRFLSSLFKLSLFSPKQRNKRTDERNLKIKNIKKPARAFSQWL